MVDCVAAIFGRSGRGSLPDRIAALDRLAARSVGTSRIELNGYLSVFQLIKTCRACGLAAAFFTIAAKYAAMPKKAAHGSPIA